MKMWVDNQKKIQYILIAIIHDTDTSIPMFTPTTLTQTHPRHPAFDAGSILALINSIHHTTAYSWIPCLRGFLITVRGPASQCGMTSVVENMSECVGINVSVFVVE